MAETLVKNRWVYAFGGGSADGDASMKNLLGGKGANLAEMSALGLPVPPGFTITTEACNHYYDNDKTYPANLEEQVAALVQHGRQVGPLEQLDQRPAVGQEGNRPARTLGGAGLEQDEVEAVLGSA